MQCEPYLDIENRTQLTGYLRVQGHIADQELITIRTLTGGVSNRTVLVSRPSGDQWVLKQALSKLRVPVDWFSSPERIHREGLALRWLPQLTPEGTIPDLIFEDMQYHVLAMQAVPEPFANWKEMLLSEDLQSEHTDQFATILACIHTNAYLRRDELRAIFADTRYFESLRLEPYYGYTAQNIHAAAPFLRQLIEDTRASVHTLVHGDYSPKNILVRQGRLILLDHEVIHFGDPAFDIGFALTHLLSKANHLQRMRQEFGDAANRFWDTYVNRLGQLPNIDQLEARAVRHALACLLARVAGRSPLEYFDSAAQMRQQNAVLHLVKGPPRSVEQVVDRFVNLLGHVDISEPLGGEK